MGNKWWKSSLYLIVVVLAGCTWTNPAANESANVDTSPSDPNSLGGRQEQKADPKSMLQKLQQGELDTVPFRIGTPLSQVKKRWGEPTQEEENVVEFSEKKTIFTIESKANAQITSIESTDDRYQKITKSDIFNYWGEPIEQELVGDKFLITYRWNSFQIDLEMSGPAEDSYLVSVRLY
ncbi:DUF4309 domain-containing protein [Risungbinella massiliensis]|uniref:DUF4309 domain-containing protein n=1 Tax=Risungbinella massiliensis TaxID=1329796 RepID=UPI0005CC64DD|nr:DUF4309 domain-containing protein [Risungbinella massiliensis]